MHRSTLELVKAAIFRTITLLVESYPYLLRYYGISICPAYAQYMLIKYCRLKLYAQEMFNIQELFKETGIDNTWKNYSNLKRIAVQLQKCGKYIPYIFILYTKKYIEKTQRKAAKWQAKNPKLNLLWNP